MSHRNLERIQAKFYKQKNLYKSRKRKTKTDKNVLLERKVYGMLFINQYRTKRSAVFLPFFKPFSQKIFLNMNLKIFLLI